MFHIFPRCGLLLPFQCELSDMHTTKRSLKVYDMLPGKWTQTSVYDMQLGKITETQVYDLELGKITHTPKFESRWACKLFFVSPFFSVIYLFLSM